MKRLFSLLHLTSGQVLAQSGANGEEMQGNVQNLGGGTASHFDRSTASTKFSVANGACKPFYK